MNEGVQRAIRTPLAQQRSRQSVQRIVDAARRLVADRHHTRFYSPELAREAGVSVAGIYYWFADLDAVVDALMVDTEARVTAELAIEPSLAPDPRAIAAALTQLVARDPALAVLVSAPVPAADHLAETIAAALDPAGSGDALITAETARFLVAITASAPTSAVAVRCIEAALASVGSHR